MGWDGTGACRRWLCGSGRRLQRLVLRGGVTGGNHSRRTCLLLAAAVATLLTCALGLGWTPFRRCRCRGRGVAVC
jgi:hypothetical protein